MASRVVDLDFGSVSVHHKKPLEIAAVDHGMRGFHASDGVDDLVRLRVEDLNDAICLARQEESVTIAIEYKMVEITFLQSGQWDGLNELAGSRLLCLDNDRNHQKGQE